MPQWRTAIPASTPNTLGKPALDASLALAAIVFALVATVTPGPNNLMLAACGMTFGFRKTLPTMFGFVVGLLLLLAMVAAGLGTLFERIPLLQVALKLLGAAYLLWLGVMLWRSASG